jgi:RNA polymerase sigma factor (sigma-70 family)
VDPPLTRSFEARLNEMAGMRRLARSLLRDASLADDVVQEAALAAWRRGRESDVPPSSWWAAVVRNVAAKMGRGARRREERERAAARPEVQPGADVVARRLALHRAVVAAVERLPTEQRDVVVRRWFDGQKPQQIAAELGVPLATVKTRLRRALAQLRERLRREWGDGVAGLLLTLARPPVGAGVAATGLAAGAIVMSTKLKLALAGVMVALAGAWVAGELVQGFGRARLKASPPASVDAASVDRAEEPRTESAAKRIEQPREAEHATAPPLDPRRVATITGVVLGPSGPFAGVRVELVRTIGRDLFVHPALRDVLPERRLRTVSAADGSFEFADVDRGVGFSIEASAEPDLFGSTSSALRAGDHVLVTISAFARLTGVVRRTGGEPIAGATVVARTVGGSDVAIERRTTSDATGRFELERMAVWPVMVQAFTADGGLMPPERVELRSGGVTEVELAVGEGFALEGVVVDERDGHAIPGARIYFATCEDFGHANRDIESVPIAVTDDGGRFRLHAAFEWQLPNLHVSARGYGLQSFDTPKPADPAPRVEVRLRTGRAIVGRVIDATGSPVADAVVHRRGGVDCSQATISIRNDFGVARTADDGRFRLEDADPRSDHLLTVQHEGFADTEVRVRGDATRDADRDVGDVAVQRGALVAGTVLDAERRPVPYAWVYLESEEKPRSTDSRERFREMCFLLRRRVGTATREDGTFSFGDVAPGSWSVTSRDSTVGGARVSVTVQADEILEDLELVIDKGWKISGRVVDDEGRPVTSAWISVERPPDPSLTPKIENIPSARSTDLDGTFTFDCVPAGTYRVRARFVGGQRRARHRLAPALVEDIDAGRGDVTIVMHDGAFLFGAVKNSDGTNAADARVEVVDLEGRRLERVACGSNGEFELVVSRPGPEELASSTARRVRLVVTGAPRDPFALHPTPSTSMTVDDVELDGPELAIRLPPDDR